MNRSKTTKKPPICLGEGIFRDLKSFPRSVKNHQKNLIKFTWLWEARLRGLWPRSGPSTSQRRAAPRVCYRTHAARRCSVTVGALPRSYTGRKAPLKTLAKLGGVLLRSIRARAGGRSAGRSHTSKHPTPPLRGGSVLRTLFKNTPGPEGFWWFFSVFRRECFAKKGPASLKTTQNGSLSGG